MHGVIDRKPAGDDRGTLLNQQWVEVDVHFSYGIMGTVGVMVQHSDT